MELSRWSGTRFWSGCGAKAKPGLGVDCVSLVEQAYANIGAIDAIAWPKYVAHGGGVEMLKIFTGVMDGIPRFKIVWRSPSSQSLYDALMFGDVILVSSGRALHHLCVFVGDNTVVHCLEKYGVTTGSVHDPLIANHARFIYRALRHGLSS